MAKKPSKYPEEVRIADLIAGIRDKADKADRDYTDAETKQIGDLKRQLGGMKFMRLAEKRVNAALKQIGNVAGLAAKSYIYTPVQAKSVVDAMANAVNSAKSAFDAPGSKSKSMFSLKDA
jgi:hypothetical protein